MKLHCFSNLNFQFLSCFRSGDATWQVRHVRRPVSLTRLVNHRVFSHDCFSRSACRSTLFNVLGCTSSPGCPETVTVPDLAGCRNCRWLPRERSTIHPSRLSSFRSSLTFMITHHHSLSPRSTKRAYAQKTSLRVAAGVLGGNLNRVQARREGGPDDFDSCSDRDLNAELRTNPRRRTNFRTRIEMRLGKKTLLGVCPDTPKW